MKTSLTLTTSGYWQQIEEKVQKEGFPPALADTLKSLLSAHIHQTIGPDAKSREIALAKQYVPDGILLEHSAGEEYLDLVVYKPEAGRENQRTFFGLVKRYPNTKRYNLNDVPEN
jgi:hypothetical protein